MNGAPTGDATNQPPQNNNQPTPRPHPPTRNATDHMCRSGTGRHEWRPHRLRRKPADEKPQTNRRPARIRRHATRPTTCAVPAPGVINGAPTDDAANRPTQCRKSTARKRRGATCDARMTDEMPQTSATKRQTNRRPAHIRRHATRPTTCAVPAPGVINGAPTGDAAKQPRKTTFNRRKRRGATCDARMADAKQHSTAAPPTSADTQRDRPHVPFRHRAS